MLEKEDHENKTAPKVGDSRTNDPVWLDTLPRYTVITEANPHNPIPLIAQKTEEDRWGEPWQNIGDDFYYDSEAISFNAVCTIIWLPEIKQEN